MQTTIGRVLLWTPRVLCILFAAFLSVFALDVFGEGGGVGETLLALLIHLIPMFAVVVSLIIAWRRQWVGAILLTALALFFLISSGGESWVVSAPLILVGALFLLSWIARTQPAP
jgi:hypothetical protein